jgi:hypothetical protein
MRYLLQSLTKAVAIMAVCLMCVPAYATQITINPSDDGGIYQSGSILSWYLESGGGYQGVVEFPTSPIAGGFSQAMLSVNPYALPLWGTTVQVFGYGSNDGKLTSSDYNSGTFLGNWVLPNIGYGQDAFFDVTQFLSGVSDSYVGFNLRSTGVDQFSSLEHNYGHPSQLVLSYPASDTVSGTPEPPGIMLMISGIAALGFIAVLRKKNRSASDA